MIKITNLNKAFSIDEKFLRKVISDISRRLKLKKEKFEFVFLDKRRIRKLNSEFTGRGSPTDVLAFRLEGRKGEEILTYVNIFISLDAARENSRTFGTSFDKEVVLYIIHGILHVAGYDDKSRPDRLRMRRREEELLHETCANRGLSRVLTQA